MWRGGGETKGDLRQTKLGASSLEGAALALKGGSFEDFMLQLPASQTAPK